MNSPSPRAAIRNLAALLLGALMIVLKYYFQGMPTELVGIIPGVYMGVFGTAEALWDYTHGGQVKP